SQHCFSIVYCLFLFLFFRSSATTEIYTLSLHDALPIWGQNGNQDIDNFIYSSNIAYLNPGYYFGDTKPISGPTAVPAKVTNPDVDRKSTRLNSSHVKISYAVFCLKKKKKNHIKSLTKLS